MRLHLILPSVEPDQITPPRQCPNPRCKSKRLYLHQQVPKPLRDTALRSVVVHRYRCLTCGHTFRVYPKGVTQDHTSQRVKGLAVLLYLLGLSYGATSLAMQALGIYMCKSRIYDTVQEAARRVPGLKRGEVFGSIKTPAMGGDLTMVKCRGKWLPLGLTVDPISGLVLTVDAVSGEDARTLREWMAPIAKAVGAQIVVTDDADGFKEVVDGLGMEHQVCKSHVLRNTDALIESLTPEVAQDKDGSLQKVGVTPQEAVADLRRLGELIRSRQVHEGDELEGIHLRYKRAPPPKKGEKASLAYRLRLLFLDRWELWERLTRYRTWRGPNDEELDGTNNPSERAIGNWVKERYRPMRGYKVEANAVRVSRLLAWAGNHLDRGGADLGALLG
jgi:transposase-like protein